MISKRKGIFFINIFLLLIILFFVFFKFNKTRVSFDCSYGSRPGQLLDVLEKKFPHLQGSKLNAVCIFNQLPTLGTLEDIRKLYRLYGNRFSFGIVFTDRFRTADAIAFPYKTMSGYKFVCGEEQEKPETDYFLLFQGKKIIHTDTAYDFSSLNFAFQKSLNPDLSIGALMITSRKLKVHVVEKLKSKDLQLLDVHSGKRRNVDDLDQYSEIYFFHARCSGCELKKLFSDAGLMGILDEKKILMIFSVFANRVELEGVMKESQTNFPVLIDSDDMFLLASKLTDEKENPVVIRVDELRGV